jgi:hypothetical protein
MFALTERLLFAALKEHWYDDPCAVTCLSLLIAGGCFIRFHSFDEAQHGRSATSRMWRCYLLLTIQSCEQISTLYTVNIVKVSPLIFCR